MRFEEERYSKRGYIVANVITAIRIICALGLTFCPTFSTWFYVLYVIGGISDVLDGIVARALRKETKLGARLDTIADIVFAMIVIVKVVQNISIPVWMVIWIVCIAVIKCISIVTGCIISKRFVSEHTVMNKICGILLFAIPFCVDRFPWQPVEVLVIVTCTFATIAAIQEGYYIRIGKEVS